MPEVKMESARIGADGNGRGNDQFLNQPDFEQIYTRNSGRMFAAAYKILCNVEDAEDAVDAVAVVLIDERYYIIKHAYYYQ